jgi:hypothetical protein
MPTENDTLLVSSMETDPPSPPNELERLYVPNRQSTPDWPASSSSTLDSRYTDDFRALDHRVAIPPLLNPLTKNLAGYR